MIHVGGNFTYKEQFCYKKTFRNERFAGFR